MRIVVTVRKKIPVDEFTVKEREALESALEDVDGVDVANFDDKVMKVYLEYHDPYAKPDDDPDETPDLDVSSFRKAVNNLKRFTFVSVGA